MRRAGALAAMWGLTACVTAPTGVTTWEDDRLEGVAAQAAARPLPDPDAPRLRLKAPPTSPDPEVVAHDLELTLLRFTARRRALSQELGESSGAWPAPMVQAWDDVLADVERALGAALLPRRLLVQVRVTLEAELELTQRRHGAGAPALATRVRQIYTQVALQLRRSFPEPERRARAAGDARFSWPVSPQIVSSAFGFRRDPILGARRVRFHAGLDLAGRQGDIVSAAGTGRVVQAGWQGGHGRVVTVQHPGGFVSRYAHLSRILVPVGALVDPGSPVGLMGSSGRSTGPHLHFEIYRGSVPVDPLEVLDSHIAFAAGP
ncbi:MAG: M23 family metallopeptidase [Myxococcales bacterium]|nr:M23 family metallopeptidase [Myxococcales bacterium]MCB9650326.1 M23 family metallopeptidase [Deltaproteobacteria bacterium]